MGNGVRVLLTGAGGFIGRRFLRSPQPDWALVAASRSPLEAHPGVVAARLGKSTDSLPAELDEPFDIVIHLAGSADHGLASREPWSDLEATGVTAAAILGRVTARRLVVLSSAAVYAGREGPVDPSVPLRPRMAYALSKLYVEGLVDALIARGRAREAIILRLYNAYGPGERPTRLVPRVVAAIDAGRSFVLTGDGTSLSDPLHVDDVVHALLGAARAKHLAGDRVQTFDLCGGDPRPLADQVVRIALALGREPPVVEQRPNPDEVPIRFWSSPDAVGRRLGLGPFLSLEDGVQRYAEEVGWLERGEAAQR